MTPPAMVLIRRIYYLHIANKDRQKAKNPLKSMNGIRFWSALPPKTSCAARGFLIHVHPRLPWGRDIGSLHSVWEA